MLNNTNSEGLIDHRWFVEKKTQASSHTSSPAQSQSSENAKKDGGEIGEIVPERHGCRYWLEI